jgi:hypothetical protein
MNVETPTQLKSAEERMLIKAGKDLTEVINKIFGSECKFELNISGVPNSKVSFISECNNATAYGKDLVKLSHENFDIHVFGKNHLPF